MEMMTNKYSGYVQKRTNGDRIRVMDLVGDFLLSNYKDRKKAQRESLLCEWQL